MSWLDDEKRAVEEELREKELRNAERVRLLRQVKSEFQSTLTSLLQDFGDTVFGRGFLSRNYYIAVKEGSTGSRYTWSVTPKKLFRLRLDIDMRYSDHAYLEFRPERLWDEDSPFQKIPRTCVCTEDDVKEILRPIARICLQLAQR